MNKKTIISILMILVLITLPIVFIPQWKGKSIDMNEIKESPNSKAVDEVLSYAEIVPAVEVIKNAQTVENKI